MSKKKFCIEKFVTYDASSNKSTCIIETCKKELCGKLKANIKRHYKLIHKQIIKSDDESDNEDVPICKKSKKIIKLNSSMNKNDFLKCCIGLVTKKNIPFRIFDDQEYFKQLIAPYEEKFNLHLNSSNIGTILHKANSQIKSEITSLVKQKMICLKIDIASRMEKHVLGINIQYIKDFKICINTIGMIQTTTRHTATNLKEEILKCLEDYNIGMHQVYSSSTDNGANVLKLSKLLQEMQQEHIDNEKADIDIAGSDQIMLNLESFFSIVRCAAHTIQLAAYDVIKTLENYIEECRKITKKLRTLVSSGNDEISLPCLDVVTRWNSTYKMIDTILSCKEFIENLDGLNNFDINWIFIQNFVKAFAPLAKCTLKLQKEQYILGDFFRDWLTCELELEELASLNTYAESLLNAMRNRKDKLLQHDAFAAAIYLDPRFNFSGTPFLTDDLKQSAMDHLLKVHAMVNRLIYNTNEQELINHPDLPSCSSQNDIPTSTSNAYNKLDLHVQSLINAQKEPSKIHTASIKQKLLRLCEGERVSFDTNVLEYWQKSCGRDKEMAHLVETVLAVPATQVSVERSFSALSTILTKLRSKLSKKSLSNLLIVKLNYELLSFSNLDIEDLHIIANELPSLNL